MPVDTDVEAVIERRLSELDRERVRLERALDALRSNELGEPARAMRSSAATKARPARRQTRAKASRSARKRAPRGRNKEAILEHVSAHPGATTPEIAGATGIDRGVLYSAVSRLTSAGSLRKESRPDGQVAYYVTGG